MKSTFSSLKLYDSLPEVHRKFLISALPKLQADRRILAVGAGGSFITHTMDEFSDLDLVIVYDSGRKREVMKDRKNIAAQLGSLLTAFTGEHVGEPRLLICLFGPPLLHVDLKFITRSEISDRIEDPVILWENNKVLSTEFEVTKAVYPQPELQWIEDRFWPWIHYIASKIGRGELFEAVDGLAFLRGNVLGPLILSDKNKTPSGVRRIEEFAPSYVNELSHTISKYQSKRCIRALNSAINLYRKLRQKLADNTLRISVETENAVIDYVNEIEKLIRE